MLSLFELIIDTPLSRYDKVKILQMLKLDFRFNGNDFMYNGKEFTEESTFKDAVIALTSDETYNEIAAILTTDYSDKKVLTCKRKKFSFKLPPPIMEHEVQELIPLPSLPQFPCLADTIQHIDLNVPYSANSPNKRLSPDFPNSSAPPDIQVVTHLTKKPRPLKMPVDPKLKGKKLPSPKMLPSPKGSGSPANISANVSAKSSDSEFNLDSDSSDPIFTYNADSKFNAIEKIDKKTQNLQKPQKPRNPQKPRKQRETRKKREAREAGETLKMLTQQRLQKLGKRVVRKDAVKKDAVKKDAPETIIVEDSEKISKTEKMPRKYHATMSACKSCSPAKRQKVLPESEPEIVPEPEPVPEPAPVSEPEPVHVSESVSEPVPVSEPEHVPKLGSETIMAGELTAEEKSPNLSDLVDAIESLGKSSEIFDVNSSENLEEEKPESGNLEPEKPESGNLEPEKPESGNLEPEKPESGNLEPEKPESGNLEPEKPVLRVMTYESHPEITKVLEELEKHASIVITNVDSNVLVIKSPLSLFGKVIPPIKRVLLYNSSVSSKNTIIYENAEKTISWIMS